MRRGIVSIVAVLTLVVVVASSAFAQEYPELEIQVAPQTLVISSGGGKLSVHTNVPYTPNNGALLSVDGTEVSVWTFPDSCGRLVAQCTKSDVAGVLGEFDGKTTKATIVLEVYGDSDEEEITVKK